MIFRINWHAATVAAIRLQLIKYEQHLEYRTEHVLSKEQGHGQRIDLLVIKKLSDIRIPIELAAFFSRLNVFEIKGKGDTLGTDDYYKASGYVSQLIWMTGDRDEYTRDDVTLSFVTQARPVKLLSHLKSLKDMQGNPRIGIEKKLDGIYYIYGETYGTQLIIMKELPPEEYRFMRCICDAVKDRKLTDRVAAECEDNIRTPGYAEYASSLCDIINPHIRKEEYSMYEGILRLMGTTEEELVAKATKKQQEEIDKLSYENRSLNDTNRSLNDENSILRALLAEHNIPLPAQRV